MRTIETIRISKGFANARDFANHIGLAGPNYSQLATGKKLINHRVILRLKSRYPDEEFDDLLPIENKKERTLMTELAEQAVQNPVVFQNQAGSYRALPYRPLPVIKTMDRANIAEILSTGLRDLEINNVLNQNLLNARADYFILEAGQEPYAEGIRTGDRLLCYEVLKKDWFRLAEGSTIIIYSSDKIDALINIGSNLLYLEDEDGYIQPSTNSKKYFLDQIKYIYQVESLYRLL